MMRLGRLLTVTAGYEVKPTLNIYYLTKYFILATCMFVGLYIYHFGCIYAGFKSEAAWPFFYH